MEPKTGSNDTDFSKYNRPIEPSGPNPCSYIRGPGHCQPPKWYVMVHSIPYSMWYVIIIFFLKKESSLFINRYLSFFYIINWFLLISDIFFISRWNCFL
jgi:hypothetical protein